MAVLFVFRIHFHSFELIKIIFNVFMNRTKVIKCSVTEKKKGKRRNLAQAFDTIHSFMLASFLNTKSHRCETVLMQISGYPARVFRCRHYVLKTINHCEYAKKLDFQNYCDSNTCQKDPVRGTPHSAIPSSKYTLVHTKPITMNSFL